MHLLELGIFGLTFTGLRSVFIFQKRGIGLDNYKSKESLSRVVETENMNYTR